MIRRTTLALAAVIAATFAISVAAAPADALSYHAIQNQNTKRCLDDSFAYGLRAFGCNGLDFQKWAVYEPAGQNSPIWFLKNLATGRCVDDSAAYGLRAFPCNNMNFQQWGTPWFSPSQMLNMNTKLCLDDSLDYGLRAFPCNNLDYQSWSWAG